MSWFKRGRGQITFCIGIAFFFLTVAFSLIWLNATNRPPRKTAAAQRLGSRKERIHSTVARESIPSRQSGSVAVAPALASTPAMHFHKRAIEAPNWTVTYGKEFWHPTTSKHGSKIAKDSRDNPGFDLDRLIQRVSNIFAEESRQAVVKTATYTAKFGNEGLEFTTGAAMTGAESVPSEKPPIGIFKTLAVLQSGEPLYDRSQPSVSSSVLGNTAQVLLNEQSGIVEHYEALDEGVAVTWVLSKAPAESQPLSILAQFSGLDYVGETSLGKHFADRNGVARVRIGNATAVDASGQRWPLVTAILGRTLEIVVPETVLSQAAYPLAIDPVIGPEVGMDAPLIIPASGDQLNPAVGTNGREYFVVWADRRSPISATWWDLYGARVSAEGQVLDPNGILIARQPGEPVSITSNGHGYLVTWNFFNIWNYGIWGARISEDGVLLDARPGALVVNETGRAGTPSVASNGDNYLLTWAEANNVFGAIINSTGPLSTPSRIAICERTAVPGPVAAASDGHDYFVTWTDSRSGTAETSAISGSKTGAAQVGVPGEGGTPQTSTIYGNKVSPNGSVTEINGFSVLRSQSGVSLSNEALFFYRTNYLSLWTDGSGVIYATTVDVNGKPLSTKSIPPSSGAERQFVWSSDGLSIVDFSYQIPRPADPTVETYTATVSVWTPEGGLQSPITLATNLPSASTVGRVGNNYLLANMERTGGYDYDISARLRSVDGTAANAKDFTVSTSGNSQYAPSIASNGSQYLVVWADSRNTNFAFSSDIYAIRLDLEGRPLDPSAIAVCMAEGSQVSPAVASNGSDYLVTWIDKSGQLAANGVSSNGVVSHPNGFNVGTALSPALLPSQSLASVVPPHALASNGTNYLAVWVNYNGADNRSYHLSGAVIGGNNTLLKSIPDIVPRTVLSKQEKDRSKNRD